MTTSSNSSKPAAKKAVKKETKTVATKATKKKEESQSVKPVLVQTDKAAAAKKALAKKAFEKKQRAYLKLVEKHEKEKNRKRKKKKSDDDDDLPRVPNLYSLHDDPDDTRANGVNSTFQFAFRVRAYRAFHQGIRYVGRTTLDEENMSQTFVVEGNSGSTYTVTISENPECSCPDNYEEEHVCKHIIFVLHRVLGVPKSSPLLAQESFIESEVEDILENGKKIRVPDKFRASTRRYARSACDEELEDSDEEEEEEDDEDDNDDDDQNLEDAAPQDRTKKKQEQKRAAPNMGEKCDICSKPLVDDVLFCFECKHAIHRECWDNYNEYNGYRDQCMMCDGEFEDFFGLLGGAEEKGDDDNDDDDDDDDDDNDDEKEEEDELLMFDDVVRRVAKYEESGRRHYTHYSRNEMKGYYRQWDD